MRVYTCTKCQFYLIAEMKPIEGHESNDVRFVIHACRDCAEAPDLDLVTVAP